MTTKGLVPKLWRFTKRVFFWLFIFQFVYILYARWCNPPITFTQLGSVLDGYGLKRDYVKWSDMGYNIKLAAIASEDQLFPDHNGFDWDAIEKSFKPRKSKKNKKSKIPLGGGASTISQQVAKNVFLWQGSGVTRYIRKLPEMYFTKMIEWTWGKKRILEVYLNTIEMGKGIFGIEAAAQAYFHKPAKNLTKEEAAKIVACFPNPKTRTVVPMSSEVALRYPKILHEMNNIEEDEDIQAIIK
jgi:monofunctional biosynthetic peptidoglycan transglycosylase